MSENFQMELSQEFNSLKKNIDKPNILLVGGTGVGKSSLLNLCFGEDIVATGVGKPVTQHIDKFCSATLPIVLFDSKGYEIGSKQEIQFQSEVIDLCTRPQDQIKNRPHLVWYCIQAIGARITDFDIKVIRKIQLSGIPIAIILTKADLVSDEDSNLLKKAILTEFSEIQIFETTIKEDLNGIDLEKLITWSIEALPSALKMAFVSAQKSSLKEKKEHVKSAIIQHTSMAFATGFIPIPVSSAPLLLANQSALLARILYIYNLDSKINNLSGVIQAALASSLPITGKYLASQILKLFPGIGTFLGGSINGSIAASITSAFGFAVSEACANVIELGLDNFDNNIFMKNFNENIIQIFLDYLKKGNEK